MKTALETINELRTIHGDFSDKEIPDDILKKILDSSVKTANSSARQAYSIIVTKKKDVMSSFGYTGSIMLIYCIDYKRQRKLAEHLGYEHGHFSFRDVMLSSIDASLAAQTAVIAAKALGVDTLITNCIHRGDIKRVYTALQLPDTDVFPVIAVVLGYPKDNNAKGKGRLNDKAIIHHETYTIPDDMECSRITKIYDRKDMGMIPPETWDKEGYNHYLEWFFERWIRIPKAGTDTAENDQPQKDQYDDIFGSSFGLKFS